MKLRFQINQAEAFRKGIDAPKSIITLEVDPSKLGEPERNLIADRLVGIDVMKSRMLPDEAQERITAEGSSFEDLIAAIEKDGRNHAKAREEIQKATDDKALKEAKEALFPVQTHAENPSADFPLGTRFGSVPTVDNIEERIAEMNNRRKGRGRKMTRPVKNDCPV